MPHSRVDFFFNKRLCLHLPRKRPLLRHPCTGLHDRVCRSRRVVTPWSSVLLPPLGPRRPHWETLSRWALRGHPAQGRNLSVNGGGRAVRHLRNQWTPSIVVGRPPSHLSRLLKIRPGLERLPLSALILARTGRPPWYRDPLLPPLLGGLLRTLGPRWFEVLDLRFLAAISHRFHLLLVDRPRYLNLLTPAAESRSTRLGIPSSTFCPLSSNMLFMLRLVAPTEP